jgi:hypothetical protein
MLGAFSVNKSVQKTTGVIRIQQYHHENEDGSASQQRVRRYTKGIHGDGECPNNQRANHTRQ